MIVATDAAIGNDVAAHVVLHKVAKKYLLLHLTTHLDIIYANVLMMSQLLRQQLQHDVQRTCFAAHAPLCLSNSKKFLAVLSFSLNSPCDTEMMVDIMIRSDRMASSSI